MQKSIYLKVLLFQAQATQLEAYETYIENVVEPIDQMAVQQGCMVGMQTVKNEDTQQEANWSHARVLIFNSEQQRKEVKQVFAKVAA